MIRPLLTCLFLSLTSACTTIERAALPDPVLFGPGWERTAQVQRSTVDHTPWDGFLKTYLSTDAQGVNRLAYAQVTDPDRAALQRYLASLQQISPATLTRDQQLAYWINLYNAQTVELVLDAYPVDSILNIKEGVLPTGPWNRKVVTIDSQPLSLNDIEHRIVRPVFREARIHYALNCAATSCPNLSPMAWRADGLDAALAAAERAYVNDPRGVQIAEDGTITLSKIYAWFKEDFGDTEADIIARLAAVANPPLREQLQARKQVARYRYDWSLNDAAQTIATH
jgi:hypothetical protein